MLKNLAHFYPRASVMLYSYFSEFYSLRRFMRCLCVNQTKSCEMVLVGQIK